MWNRVRRCHHMRGSEQTPILDSRLIRTLFFFKGKTDHENQTCNNLLRHRYLAGARCGLRRRFRRGPTHPLTFVKDSVITTKVKANLADEKMSSLAHISVDTDSNGAVVLKGKVRSQEEADKAASIARGTEGVTSVKSNLQIKKDD